MLTKIEPALGNETDYAYGTTVGQGDFGQVTSITYYGGLEAPTLDQGITALYTYDAAGNLSSEGPLVGPPTWIQPDVL